MLTAALQLDLLILHQRFCLNIFAALSIIESCWEYECNSQSEAIRLVIGDGKKWAENAGVLFSAQAYWLNSALMRKQTSKCRYNVNKRLMLQWRKCYRLLTASVIITGVLREGITRWPCARLKWWGTCFAFCI